jgi:hypothetical protein
MGTRCENEMSEAVGAFAEMMTGRVEPSVALRPVLRIVAARGGVMDDGKMINTVVFQSVAEEVVDRYMAELSARVGPRIDAISPEAGTIVDEELAQIRADIVVAMFAALSK